MGSSELCQSVLKYPPIDSRTVSFVNTVEQQGCPLILLLFLVLGVWLVGWFVFPPDTQSAKLVTERVVAAGGVLRGRSLFLPTHSLTWVPDSSRTQGYTSQAETLEVRRVLRAMADKTGLQ